ncbi:MAG TPA: class F sortase [Pseudonocardia sp.]
MLTDQLYALIGEDAAEAIALGSAVLAGVLLWVLAGRLRVSPASGAAVLALYSAALLVIDLQSGPGVDGTGLLLLVAAATLSVGGGRVRNGAALVLLVLAVGAIPVAAVGLLVLLGGMALTGGIVHRLPKALRVAAAIAAIVCAAAVAILLARPDEPAALPAFVPAVLTLWALLVVGILWRRLPWLRAVCAAVLGLTACLWIPGPDADATLVVAAAGALLTAIAAEDTTAVLARRAFVAVAAAAVVGSTVLLTPTVAGQGPALLRPPANVPAAAVAVPVRPVAVAIPALGVTGPLEDLVADPATRELSAPNDPARAGWYAAGVVPGDQGPAVIGGHVDSRRGPGVFFRLRTLYKGDLIEVTRSDGRTVRFSVLAVALFPKDAFPTQAVYGPTPGPELRLVTCGGTFDRSVRSYADNVVVDAALV